MVEAPGCPKPGVGWNLARQRSAKGIHRLGALSRLGRGGVLGCVDEHIRTPRKGNFETPALYLYLWFLGTKTGQLYKWWEGVWQARIEKYPPALAYVKWTMGGKLALAYGGTLSPLHQFSCMGWLVDESSGWEKPNTFAALSWEVGLSAGKN